MREDEEKAAIVLNMATFKRRRPAPVKVIESEVDCVESSFHIDIMGSGSIKTQPLLVTRGHALGMLEIFIAVSAQILDTYRGMGGS
jgi:hypothetical protein